MTGPVAAITGIGVVAPGRTGKKAFWSLLTEGQTATRTISLFDPAGFRSRIAAECDFDPAAEGLRPQEIRRMDRAAQFAVVAAREALADSGLDLAEMPDPRRVAVSIGSAVGCTMALEREYVVLSDAGRSWLVDHSYGVPHLYGHMVPSTLASEVAVACGAEGPVALISTGCTSGLDSVGHAAALIGEGSADVVIAGATDAPISPITVACFDAIRATSPNNADPGHASRPFDLHRDGFVLGEGAAVLVLEDLERARCRGARVYALISGFASRSNAFHMTGLRPDGREMAEAIRAAMRRARVTPADVDYVNAHGSGTRQNDRHETAAFKASLGERARQVPVSSIKSMIGHSLGAIGSLEIAACALAIEHDTVPPTANLSVPDPECDLDYVPAVARQVSVSTVLSVGSGFGGFQTAMILRRAAGGDAMTATAVVTGLGIVAPNGVGTHGYWAATMAGTSGIGPITSFDPAPYPVRLAGEVTGLDAAAHLPPKLMVQTDRWTHLGLIAAELALADARADPASMPEYELAVVTASSSGGTEFGQREIEKLWQHGPGHVGAYQSIAWFYAATTGQISIRHQMRGPCGVIATEQAGGLDVLGQARRLLRADASLVVTGGTDASLCPYGLTAQLTTGLLSTCPDPARAYLPFDAAASGYLPGEGGAIMIVEDAERARARGGPEPYGTVAGYAAGFDPPRRSGRPPALARVISAALVDASLAPGDVGVVFADAAGVPELDAAEAEAISSVFGRRGVPVTAPKALTGRLYAGGAALDVATALLSLRHGMIPPTPGTRELAASCRQLDLVRGEPRPLALTTGPVTTGPATTGPATTGPVTTGPVNAALVLARGFSGFNAAVVLCAPPPRRGDHHE